MRRKEIRTYSMVQPRYITLSNWAASLVIDFPDDDVPILMNEKDWKKWGNRLVECSTFAQNAAPGTAFYKDWQSWAMDVFKTTAFTSVEIIKGCHV